MCLDAFLPCKASCEGSILKILEAALVTEQNNKLNDVYILDTST